MRTLALIALTGVSLLASRPQPSEAAAYNLPWCARYFDQSGITACSFYSYQQCMASVSGVGGFCLQNPNVPPPPPPYAAYRRPNPRRDAQY